MKELQFFTLNVNIKYSKKEYFVLPKSGAFSVKNLLKEIQMNKQNVEVPQPADPSVTKSLVRNNAQSMAMIDQEPIIDVRSKEGRDPYPVHGEPPIMGAVVAPLGPVAPDGAPATDDISARSVGDLPNAAEADKAPKVPATTEGIKK